MYRGKYSSELGAKKALVKYGTIESTLDEHFNQSEVNMCNRGDIVLYESELGLTLGVKWANGVATSGYDGLLIVSVPTEDIKCVWSL